jgi:hypothetical protein
VPKLPRVHQRDELRFVFNPRYAREIDSRHARLPARRYDRIRRRMEADQAASAYRDQALMPVSNDELATLEIFNSTDSAKAAAEKARRPMPPRLLRAVGT